MDDARFRFDIDTEHLPEQRLEALRVVERISARAAVTHTDVEITAGAETDLAAVVIGERLLDLEQNGFALRIGDVAARLIHGNNRVTAQVRVVDVEALHGSVVGRKGKSQQPLLPVAGSLMAD